MMESVAPRLCAQVSPSSLHTLSIAHTLRSACQINAVHRSHFKDLKFLLFHRPPSITDEDGRKIAHSLQISTASTVMDIVPFVRFEEAYDPFQATVTGDASYKPKLLNTAQQITLPKLDFIECEQCYCLMVDLPGFGPEDVQCAIQDNFYGGELRQELFINEVRQAATIVPHLKEEFVSYIVTERSHGRVRRSVMLPVNANADAAICTLRQGLLTIVMPKLSTKKAVSIE